MQIFELECLKVEIEHGKNLKKANEELFDLIHKEENKQHEEYLRYIENRFIYDSKRNTDSGVVTDRIIKAIDFVIGKLNDGRKA